MLGTDPVEVGLVASLSRPGVNLTGVTTLNVEIVPKRLEVLRELLPATNIMAIEGASDRCMPKRASSSPSTIPTASAMIDTSMVITRPRIIDGKYSGTTLQSK